jgi:hypothetical protein
MIRSDNAGAGARAPDFSAPPDRQRFGAARVGLALLLLGGCLFLLVWIGQGARSVVETYGGLGGGWAELLVLLAVGAGVVVGGCLVVIVRRFDRAPRARWLLLIGVVLALLATALGAALGSLAHADASALSAHACDDPVGPALVSFAEGLEPGPVVIQDGELTSGRDDGSCLVLVNLAPDADVAAEIARVAAAHGWSRLQEGWLSPAGVSMTYDATSEPDTMTLVELQGRRADAR